ncbi:MAG: zinc-dependent alcohol dehydrogenase family protein [Terriglobales bacterium]
MQALVLERPAPVASQPLSLVSLPDPEPGAGQLLLRVRCCGVCRTDLHVVEGELPVRRPRITPGHQVVATVAALGPDIGRASSRPCAIGDRVGLAWLHRTDGTCRFCRSGRENLCPAAEFTGWTQPGGYAELCLADAGFVYPLPAAFSDLDAAPLLCAGIIGYRSLQTTGLGSHCPGARLGIYGFGAAGHVVIQLARARGAEVYVATRDERHQRLAADLGAVWVGGAAALPPVPLDAAIMFAPAGELVPVALRALDAAGVLVLGGIHMSPIPALDYDLLYRERVIRSVANNTREDGRAFLAEAAAIPIRTRVTAFPLAAANDALSALKHDAFAGAAVLTVAAS